MAKEHEQHEDFLSRITRAIETFIEKYLKIIIISVSSIVVILALYFSIDYVFSKGEQKANAAFGKVYLAYRSAMNDQNLKEENLKKKLYELNEDFKLVIQDYPKSKSAAKSAYFISNTLYRGGDYEKAIEYYQKGAAGQRKYYITFLSLMGIASCQEQLKNYDKAAKIYEEILISYRDRYIAPTVMFNLGQVLEKVNKLQKAEDEYSAIVSDFKWSSWKDLAEKRIILIKNFM